MNARQTIFAQAKIHMNKIYSLSTNKRGMNRVKNHNATGKPVTTRIISDVLGRMMSRSSSDGSEASYSYDAGLDDAGAEQCAG
jgi:hypothetical protein